MRYAAAFWTLDEFNAFLKSRDGGKKSERNAKRITVNVCKYLYWCDAGNLGGDHLARTKQVKAYIGEMEKSGPLPCSRRYTTLRLPFVFPWHARKIP